MLNKMIQNSWVPKDAKRVKMHNEHMETQNIYKVTQAMYAETKPCM